MKIPPLVVLIAGSVCLGIAPVAVRASGLPPEVSAFLRVSIAAPIFLGWCVLVQPMDGPAVETPRGSLFPLFCLAAATFAADLAAMHYAIGATSVALATLFTNCAPFFVGFLGLVGLSDRPSARFWKSLPVSLAGVALLLSISGADSRGTVTGDLVGLAAGGLYGGYLIVVKALRARGVRSGQIMAVVTLGSTALLLPSFILSGAELRLDGRAVVALAMLVLVGQIGGQGLVTVALQRLPVSSSSLVLLIQPVVAAVLSWLLFGESLSGPQVLGMGMVLVAIYASLTPGRDKTAPRSPPRVPAPTWEPEDDLSACRPVEGR